MTTMKTNHLNNNKLQHGSDQKIPPKFQLPFILVIVCPSCSDLVSINIYICHSGLFLLSLELKLIFQDVDVCEAQKKEEGGERERN